MEDDDEDDEDDLDIAAVVVRSSIICLLLCPKLKIEGLPFGMYSIHMGFFVTGKRNGN